MPSEMIVMTKEQWETAKLKSVKVTITEEMLERLQNAVNDGNNDNFERLDTDEIQAALVYADSDAGRPVLRTNVWVDSLQEMDFIDFYVTNTDDLRVGDTVFCVSHNEGSRACVNARTHDIFIGQGHCQSQSGTVF